MFRILVAFFAAASVAATQTAPRTPTFGAGTDVVSLTATVTDEHGRYVTDLTIKDFAVHEDMVPQELSPELFSHEQLPISLALMIDASDSMVVFDAATGHVIPGGKLDSAKAAAIEFVKTLRPQDEAEIVRFSGRPEPLQDFTADHDALEKAIQGISTREEVFRDIFGQLTREGNISKIKDPKERGKKLAELGEKVDDLLRDVMPSGNTALYTSMYITIKDLEKRGDPKELRRKAIIVITDGEDNLPSVKEEVATEKAKQAGVTIYTIGLGLNEDRASRSADIREQRAIDFLKAIANVSGGRHYFIDSPRELKEIYNQIAGELRFQYSLGYVSTNPARNGKWRVIESYISSRTGLHVRTKQGYYAPKP